MWKVAKRYLIGMFSALALSFALIPVPALALENITELDSDFEPANVHDVGACEGDDSIGAVIESDNVISSSGVIDEEVLSPSQNTNETDSTSKESGTENVDDGSASPTEGDMADSVPASPVGWVERDGLTYYVYSDGALATFAQVIDGKNYYFWSNGVMASSRIWNGCYYDADGAMLVNSWFNIGGARYHAGDDGKLARGTVSINGKDYYFWSNYQMAQNALWNGHIYRIDGVMAKGRWYNLKGARYYIKEDGSLTYGNVRIDGKDYHFWSNAQMATNAIYGGKIYGPQGYTLSNTFFDYKGERYYAKFDGSYAIHAQRIDGEDYYFWSNGIMVCNRMYGNHYYLSNGVMAKFCWVDNEQYWVDKNGIWVPDMPAKVGWQNPYGYYQVSSKSMHMPAGYYATPSRINPYSSRGDCVEAFVNRAWDYIGTPYIWNYSDAPGVGVDCIGLVYQCAYACGMDLGEFNPYDHWITGPGGWHSHDANNMWNYGAIQRLSLGARQRGDLIFWRGHVAIYLGGDRIIEAYPGYVRECSLWAHSNPIGVGRIFL